MEPEALGDLLGVWAHPDDEAYLSAGVMAKAIDSGHRVVCVTATKGEAGFPDDDPRDPVERMAVRAAECAVSLGILGVREHRWLGYSDGGCDQVDDSEPIAKLAAMIDEIRPDTVLTFGPEGMTGHSDHVAVSRWATAAARAAQHQCRLLYATKTPDWNERFIRGFGLDGIMMVEGMEPPADDGNDLVVQLTLAGPLLDRKVEALRAQESQTASMREAVGETAFREWVADEFFRAFRADDWSALSQ